MSACPDSVLATVAVNWPLIRDALVAEGFRDPATFLAAIATTYVETHIGDYTFKPIKEFGGVAYFTANYEDNREVAAQLGNTRRATGHATAVAAISRSPAARTIAIMAGARGPP